MKSTLTTSEYKDFFNDLKAIKHKVNSFGMILLENNKENCIKAIHRYLGDTNLNLEDVSNLVDLCMYDYKARNKVGMNSLSNDNLIEDIKNNSFYNIALLLSSDNVFEENKKLILKRLENNDNCSYAAIVYESKIQGLFDQPSELENISFSKNIKRKITDESFIIRVNKEIEHNKILKESDKIALDRIKDFSTRFAFKSDASRDSIRNFTMNLFDNLSKIEKFTQSKKDDTSIEIKDTLEFSCKNFLQKTEKVSNVNFTKEFIYDIVKLSKKVDNILNNEIYLESNKEENSFVMGL